MELLLLEHLFSLTYENGNFIGFNLEKSIFFSFLWTEDNIE